jgi:hypothetical protein
MPCGARGLQKSARKIWIANDLEVKYREQMTYDRYRPGRLYRLRLDHDELILGWGARLDVTRRVWISGTYRRGRRELLELSLTPICPDFAVDLAGRKFALSLPSGRGANRGESFLFWREGHEKFLDALGVGSCRRPRAQGLW